MAYRNAKSRLLVGIAVAAVAAVIGTSASAAGVTLRLWHNTADPQQILKLYDRYQKASGNTLEIIPMPTDGFETATLTRWATGERPDILEYHGNIQALYQFNALENMRDLSDEPILKNGSSIYKAMGNIDGKQFAVTVGYPSVFGLFYNKEVIKRNGIALPTTFDELLATCKILKEKDPSVAPLFESGGSKWPLQIIPYMYMSNANTLKDYSGAITKRKVSVDDPEGPLVKSVSYYSQLQDAGCFNSDATTATFEDSFAAVLSGKAAFVAQHSSMLGTADAAEGGDKAKVDDAIGFIGVGVSADGPLGWFGATPFGTYYLPKTGDAEREEAALGFIRYITGEGYPQYVLDSGEPPVLKGGELPPLRPLMVEINKVYANAGTVVDVVGWADFDNLMSRVLSKQITPEEVGKQMALTIERQSKAAGLPGW